jgi:hypothetical protein
MGITTLFAVLALALPVPPDPLRNADHPLLGSWDFSPRLVWSSDQAEGQDFGRPGELRVMEDGTCVFHDFNRQVSYIFGPKGEYLCRFAAAGTGPGQVPFYLNCFIAGNEIAIGAPAALYFFSREGRFLESFPNDLFARFPVAFLGPRRGLFAPGDLRGLPRGTANLLLVDFAAGTETTFAELPVPGSEAPSGGPPVVVRGLTPTIEASLDRSSDRVYYGCSTDDLVHVARPDGAPLGSFSLERPRPAGDEAAKQAHFAQSRIPPDRLKAVLAGLPDRLASFRRLWAWKGLVLLLPPAGLEPLVATQPIDIFSADGRCLYRSELRLPDGLRFSPDDLNIAQSDLYAICHDGEGRTSLRRFSVALPSQER